jgi:transposase
VETIVERPAALDVHKAQVTACVRVPDERGRREQHVAEFATTVRGLLALRDWLAGYGVMQVVMEATGVYWKAPWAILEDEFECLWSTRATSSRWRWFSTAPPLGRRCRTVQVGRV